MVPGRVLETMSAELDGRAHDSLPEGKKRWRYSEFEFGRRGAASHRLSAVMRSRASTGFLRDPESAHIVRSEGFREGGGTRRESTPSFEEANLIP